LVDRAASDAGQTTRVVEARREAFLTACTLLNTQLSLLRSPTADGACKCAGKFRVWIVDFARVGNVNSCGLARTSLAKSVLDAGWSQLRSHLRYKALRHGGEYIEVDERFSTQVCSACAARGGPQGREDLGVREWVCSGCGARHDRGINSAINILVSGRNVGLQWTEIPSLQGGGGVNPQLQVLRSVRSHIL
jgi:hypothetical protein